MPVVLVEEAVEAVAAVVVVVVVAGVVAVVVAVVVVVLLPSSCQLLAPPAPAVEHAQRLAILLPVGLQAELPLLHDPTTLLQRLLLGPLQVLE